MGLRITQSMLFRNTLWNIQKNSRRLSILQEMLASGRKINRPSDDPTGLLRLMPLEVDINKLARNKENISLTKEILGSGTGALQDASSLIIDARTIALQGANGTLSQSDRRSLAQKIDQILSQMLAIGNTKRAGRYIFSGAKTNTAPFSLVTQNGITWVRYNGDGNVIKVEVGPGIEAETNIPGDQIFLSRNRGETEYEGITGAKAGSGTDSGVGIDILQVRHLSTTLSGSTHGITVAATSSSSDTLLGAGHTVTVGPGYRISIDGGDPVTFQQGATDVEVTAPNGGVVHLDLSNWDGQSTTFTLNSSFKLSIDGTDWTEIDVTSTIPENVQLVDSVTGYVTNVDPTDITLAGDEVVTYSGTFDVFTTLITLRDVLNNKYNLSKSRQTNLLKNLIGEVDNAHEMILSGLRELGGRMERMELVKGRVEDMEISMKDVLGDVRDIDLADVIMKLTQQETLFQTSLAVGSRVIQPSLLNFLK